MTVVRELVTKLSFDVDRRGIENFNRAILGFKSKFALAATTVAGFVAGTIKAVSAVSEGILDTTELARATGIATKELVGLQRAAGQFRISPSQFAGALTRLNDLIRDASFGFGQLFDIARQLEIEIRDDNGALLETKTIFNQIIEALGRIDDESLRIDISKRIFGEGRFADIAGEGVEALDKLATSFTPLGEKIAESEARALRFERGLNRLTEEAKELAFNIFPPLIETFGQVFEGLNLIAESTRQKGFGETFSNILDSNVAAAKKFLGTGDGVPDFIRNEIEAENEEFQRNLDNTIQGLSPEAKERFVNRRVDVNTRIEIQPPAGTEEGQREFFRQAAQEAFTEEFNDKFEEILDNFPETE